MKKSFWILCTVLCLLLTGIAIAEEPASGICGEDGDNLTWVLENGILTISGSGRMMDYDDYTSDGTNYAPWYDLRGTIGQIVLGEDVTSIGSSAFVGCSVLSEIEIPNHVETIGHRALAENFVLESVILPEGITEIASNLFENDYQLANISLPTGVTVIAESAFDHTGLTSIEFPANLQSIGKNAFRNTSLTSVSIPNSVTSLGETAFNNCRDLESITFGSGISVLPVGIASDCGNLSSITIPEGVTTISENAFSGDTRLRELVLPNGLTEIGPYALKLTAISELHLPDGITTLTNAFTNNELMDVYLPAAYDATDFYSVTDLNPEARIHVPLGSNAAQTLGHAFAPTDTEYDGLLVQYNNDGKDTLTLVSSYKSLETLTLPAAITAVGDEALFLQYKLKAVTLNEGLLTIGKTAFKGTELTSLVIPASVTEIGDEAFQFIPLTSVTFAENSALTMIGADAFRNRSLTAIELPAGIREIGNRAFLGCENLPAINLPDTLQVIGEEAFRESQIAEIVLPAHLERIGASAFADTQLSGELTIPESVTTLGDNAFGNTGIASVFFSGAETELGGRITGEEAVLYAAAVSNTAKSISKYYQSFIDINDSQWTYVWAFQDTGENWKNSYTDAYSGASAQYKDKELLVALAYRGDQASLTIPAPVGVLGENLLERHMEITAVQLPESLRIIDSKAFSHAEYLTGITLPMGTLSLGERAFEFCTAMKTVTLPESLNRLSNYTFDGCYQVPGIELPDNMTYVGNNVLGDVAGSRTFTVNIGSNTVKLLGSYEFFYDREHTEYRYKWVDWREDVYDPNTGNYMYTIDRSGLELNRYLGSASEIVVDSRVIGIGNYAFYWNNSSTGEDVCNTTLEKITFPEGMRYINSYAFYRASRLKDVSFPSTLQTISDSAFAYCAIEQLAIPENVTSIGNSAFAYCPLKMLTIPDAVTWIGYSAFYETHVPEVTLKNDGISVESSAFNLPTRVYCGLDSNTAHRLSNNYIAFVANDLDDDHALLKDCALRYISADDGTETLRLMGYCGEQRFFRLYNKIESVSSSVQLNGARIVADLDSHEAWVASYFDGNESNPSYEGFTTGETDEFNYVMNADGTASIVGYYGTSNYIDAFPEYATGIMWEPFSTYNTDYNGTNPIILAFKPESREAQMLQNVDCYFRDPDNTGIVMQWQHEETGNARLITVVKYTGTEENVIIPEGVKAIVDNAFAGKDPQYGWDVDNPIVKSITLPASMSQKSRYNLYYMSELQSVTFKGHLESFSGGISSSNLSSVHFEQGVERIEAYAFNEFRGLSDVTGLEQTSYIGEQAFCDTALTSVNIESEVELGNSAFSNNHKLIEVTFKEYVGSIPDSCFSGSEKLTSVHFMKGVDRIENNAFYDCTSLSELTGLEQSSHIGESAFYNTGLQSLAFTGSVEIGQSAFSYNHNLTEVTFSAHVDSIPNSCFLSCEKLVSVSFEAGIDRIEDSAFSACTALTNISGLEQAVYIGNSAFASTCVCTVTLADNVEIGGSAFSEDTYLTEISFLGNVKKVGGSAFYNTALTSLHIPGDIGVLEDYSIRYIPNLQSVEIDGNIQAIGQYAVYDNTQLTSFVVHGSVGTLSSYAFSNLNSLKSIEIWGNISNIAEYGIDYVYPLTSFVVHGSVDTIASNGICASYNLKNIVFGEGLKELASAAIRYDYFSDWVDLYFPASLTNMAEDAITYSDTPYELRNYLRIHAPVDSYAAHWASEKLGVFYSEDFGYIYDVNNDLILTRYLGSGNTAAPYEGIAAVDNTSGELSNVRMIASVGSDLAQKISSAGLNFTTDAESEWDYRYVDGRLYGAMYYGTQKEFTSLPSGMEGILPDALAEDVRFICNRNDPMAHMVYGFYETSASEWKLRWNESVLTLVRYTGSETELNTFPEGVTAVDAGAFDGEVSFVCDADSSMAKALGKVGYSFYTDREHSLYMQWSGEELTLMSGTNAAGDVSIPEGTTRIAWNAFYYNSNLTGVTIPASVKVIEGYAFYGCDSIRKVNLMDGLTEIGNEAFTNTSSLYELRVPDSVTKINSRIFDNGTLYLPDNISECGEQSNSNIIVHTDSVTARALGNGKTKSDYYNASFTDPDDKYRYAWLDGKLYLVGYGDDAANRSMFRNDIYGMKDGSEYAYYLKTIILPSSLRDLWSQYGNRFFGSETQSITFPEGLTAIPSGTDTYENLNTVVIPRSVTTIDDNAFGAGLMTVYGYSGTEAEAYAERKGINFVDLDGDIEDDAVISPDQQNTVLHVGETVNIHDLVTVYPALSTPYPLSASCRSTSILQVQGDEVTAVAPGTATLNVWVTDHEITEISISVTVYNPVADFEVPGDGFIDINYGGKTFYVMNVTPAGYDPNFIWKDDNGTQYSSGESSWISLYSKVQRTITVTSHNGISKTFRVIGYQTLGNMTLSAEEQMKIGQSAIPIVKIKVDSTTRTNPKDLYTLISSDESVISISENGAIRAMGAGSATVTAQHIQDMDGSRAKSVTITVTEPTELKLPAALKEIEEEAFEGIMADRVIIPSGTVTIGSRAFANSRVSVAVIPASVTSIASDAFSGVSNLTVQCEPGSAAEAFARANGYNIIH